METLQVCLDFKNWGTVFKNQEFNVVNVDFCLLLKNWTIWVSTPRWPQVGRVGEGLVPAPDTLPARGLHPLLPAESPKALGFVSS